MAFPCWMATTRRVVNERPSRMRSTRRGWDGGVARAQEVGVQRVHRPVGGSTVRAAATRAWPGHLAAEDPLAVHVGTEAAEDVDLDGLEVEQLDQTVDRHLAHGARYGADPGVARSSRRGCGSGG